MDRLLLISRGVPPETSGTAIIVGNFAKQFSSSEMIIAGEKVYGRPKVNWDKNLPKIKYIISALPDGWRGARWFRKMQIPIAFVYLLWIHLTFRPTKILCIYPKQEYLLLGYLLHYITNVDFYPYFHNTYAENNTGYNKQLALLFQKRVFEVAPIVYVMSDGMTQLYQRNYPGLKKCKPLRHTFNEQIPETPVDVNISEPFVNYAFSGNINESCREAAVRLFNTISQMPNTRIQLYSNSSKAQLANLGINTEKISITLVSRDELVQCLGAHDILLLPHGFSGGLSSEEYETIFPTKTIEYLIAGKPIFAHSPENAYITQFLKENNCAMIVDTMDETVLKKKLFELNKKIEIRQKLVVEARRTALLFQASSVVNSFKKDVSFNQN